MIQTDSTKLILMRIKAKNGQIIMGDQKKVDVKATCHTYLTNTWDSEVFNFVKDNPQFFFPEMLNIWYSNNYKSHWEKVFRSLVKTAIETKQPEQQLEQIAAAFVRNKLTAKPAIIMCEEKAISPTMQFNGLTMLISKYCETDELFEFIDKFNIDPNCRDGIIGLMLARFHPTRYEEFAKHYNYAPSETKQRLISKTLKNSVVIKKSRGVNHVS